MTSSQENTQAFVVRIWAEPREVEGAAPQWRGMIEHVESGERRYFQDLAEMTRFVGRYTAEMGGRASWRARVWGWVRGR